MHSMTGFGRASVQCDGRELTLEIKSVNHRFLDIAVHLPRVMAFAEDELKRMLSARFSRGHLEVFLTYRNTRRDAKKIEIDESLLEQYVLAFRAAEKWGVKGEISAETLLKMPEVLNITAQEEDHDAVLLLLEKAAQEACGQLLNMRLAEGGRLKQDLSEKLDCVEQCVAFIAGKAENAAQELYKKLSARLQELLGELPVDEQRLAQELAVYADRVAIDEEIVRLRAHTASMRAYMEQDEPLGRKLEFILQEINREINTIGSKAMNADIQASVITVKGELEKLREQIQNVE